MSNETCVRVYTENFFDVYIRIYYWVFVQDNERLVTANKSRTQVKGEFENDK